ncbi:hypothetical protein FIBSPDRAFT_865800 [Athelia psychrophila]|uniref:Uncharacterized protein n=1 Tax=Athelia psychrophila TaxID=1759441 RepID=A0A166FCI6_9AGAM|nr:hypothetical protein FIBSPDRAFT_865800 [Fibularhizoctonia sp. CBS 109695]
MYCFPPPYFAAALRACALINAAVGVLTRAKTLPIHGVVIRVLPANFLGASGVGDGLGGGCCEERYGRYGSMRRCGLLVLMMARRKMRLRKEVGSAPVMQCCFAGDQNR